MGKVIEANQPSMLDEDKAQQGTHLCFPYMTEEPKARESDAAKGMVTLV